MDCVCLFDFIVAGKPPRAASPTYVTQQLDRVVGDVPGPRDVGIIDIVVAIGVAHLGEPWQAAATFQHDQAAELDGR